jgi:hypothetical protein
VQHTIEKASLIRERRQKQNKKTLLNFKKEPTNELTCNQRHGWDGLSSHERDAVHDTIRQSDPTGQACINPCALDYD